MPEVLHSLALYMHDWFVANEARLDRMLFLFQLASVALILEVGAWLLTLGGR